MILYFSATGNTKYCAEYICGSNGGRADERLAEILSRKGITLHAAFTMQKLTRNPSRFFVSSQRKVKGFYLKDSRPVWTKDNCACCLACLHRCPKQAINRGKSAKNGRYINPNVTM